VSQAASTVESVPDTVYQQLQHFYAQHMQQLDDGDAEGWAGAFTEDGTFGQDTRPEPRRGRAVIAERMRLSVARLAAEGLVRRHWVGNLTVRPGPDGTLLTRYYALVVDTPGGGSATLRLSTVCDDVLVADGAGGWQVSARYIHHDGHRDGAE
jgi:SnoaL-like protein